MITYIKGDLFAANERAIAHGCNCHGVMGAGVAAIVRRNFPMVYMAYDEAVYRGEFYPGVAQPVGHVHQDDEGPTGEVTIVYNLATQNAPGRNAKYEYVAAAIRNMFRHMEFVGNDRIAMPMIGAGIGGLDWIFIHRDIIQALMGTPIEVVVYYLNDEDLPEALR